MSYKTETNTQVIADIPKSRVQTLRVSVGEFDYHPFLYLKVFDNADMSQPRAGLTLKPDAARALASALNAALAELELREKVVADYDEECRQAAGRN